MPIAQRVLLHVPPLLLGVIIVGAAVVIAVVGLIIVRNVIPHHRLKIHNDVAGPIFSTVGVVYAVLLAFVVVIVWQNYDKASFIVQSEANRLVNLYRDAGALSPEFRKEVRGLLIKYSETAINEEWPAMARGQASPAMGEITRNLWLAYSNYSPATETQKTFFGESVDNLNDMGELRRMRIMESRTGVHPLLWFVLIAGAVVTISFTFIFGAESFKAQLAMAVSLAVLISLILFTILAMDFPFTGGISVSPEPFHRIATAW